MNNLHKIVSGAVFGHITISLCSQIAKNDKSGKSTVFFRPFQALTILDTLKTFPIKANIRKHLPLTLTQVTYLTVGATLLASAIKNDHIAIPREWANYRIVKVISTFANYIDEIITCAAAVSAIGLIHLGSQVYGGVVLGCLAYNFIAQRKWIPEAYSKPLTEQLTTVLVLAQLALMCSEA